MYQVRYVNIGKTEQLDILAHTCGEQTSYTNQISTVPHPERSQCGVQVFSLSPLIRLNTCCKVEKEA